MSNAFNWQGKPSIFAAGKKAEDFNGVNTSRSNVGAGAGSTFTLTGSRAKAKPATAKKGKK